MKYIAGIDVGNSTTEVALAEISEDNAVKFLSSAFVLTTGIKGTLQNKHGIFGALQKVLQKSGLTYKDLSLIRINEAAPVIGDVAMETITETIITESTMIGHNPKTPGGIGLSSGITVMFEDILKQNANEDLVVIVTKENDFEEVAKTLNRAAKNGIKICAAIMQKDDAVLVSNRLDFNIPIIDEVSMIDKIPLGMKCAVEVAEQGKVIENLSNPYGIATVFGLTPEETKKIVPVSRALMGNRSAVVIKTPKGDVKERVIPAGSIEIIGENKTVKAGIEEGAERIMTGVESVQCVTDVRGEPGTNVGGMLEKVRQTMASLTKKLPSDIYIQDLLAVDTFVPVNIKGGLANEFSMENAVGIASMVKSDRLQMQIIAEELEKELGVKVEIGGVEANMAIMGALTTPGTDSPLAIVDMGAGSTDASIIDRQGRIFSVHLAGAGNMVTMLINSELGLADTGLAEDIKIYPLAKAESLFHIRHEDGTVQFFKEALKPEVFARVVVLKEDEMLPVPGEHSLEKIKAVRRSAKERVFVKNAIRALEFVSPTGNIRDIPFVIMVGGSALDFEIPELVTDRLAKYSIVAGRGNIRETEGPRNAVATGLILDIANKGRVK
ncbi:Diol dehydratase-reactivating factor large subunit [Sebaldella termitidis]|uniref:Diol/glycerol dehydratase reactivating factor large subunit n=1 Tax=Sebaldella termitidis (strain ATCC 33386 / NCTC 11300) TaxID=526218 RepID=D1AFL7_SEBTE|nr:diol dehydratase reactivase subunit alpha [Sebaldella termitidis]ACZ07902.1 Diol/glycerol dehydratase reactivating factor large subunit [Sebaldella termitidis ATCC 33386]SUI23203.1 Diol dehydratase-reactivating factor large subunit [Sebaldella termitidis]